MLRDLIHHPAVAWVLFAAVLGGCFMAIVNLRNIGIWLLQLTGERADGVVEQMELTTAEDNEPVRRPVVAFTTATGERVVAKPALYRRSTTLAKGVAVPVRYSGRKPTRMVVPGFGLQYREPVYASLGVMIALVLSWLFLKS